MKPKLSKEGKLFLEKIEELRIPRYDVQKAMSKIYFSQDGPDSKLNRCEEVILQYRPLTRFRPKKLRVEITNFYRHLVPKRAIRSDGKLKNNFLSLINHPELSYLLKELNEIRESNRRFLDIFESMSLIHYLSTKN